MTCPECAHCGKNGLPRSIREHWDRVGRLPCVVSGSSQVTLHHVHGGSVSHLVKKGLGQKTPDSLVIPLAPEYHTGQHGIDVLGARRWESSFGSQMDHLREISSALGYCPWKLLELERSGEIS